MSTSHDNTSTYSIVEDAPTYLPADLHPVLSKSRLHQMSYTLGIDALTASAYDELEDVDGAYWRHNATNVNPDPGRRHPVGVQEYYTMKREDTGRAANAAYTNWNYVPTGFELKANGRMCTVSFDALYGLLDAAEALEIAPEALALPELEAALQADSMGGWPDGSDMLIFPQPIGIHLPDGMLFLRGIMADHTNYRLVALTERLLHVDSPAAPAHENAAESLIAYTRMKHVVNKRAMAQPLLVPLFSFTKPVSQVHVAVWKLWNAFKFLSEDNSTKFPSLTLAPNGTAHGNARVVVVNVHPGQGWAVADTHKREYDVRWMVRGHWRNQWYPAAGVNRKIWIMAHLKGDPEKPFRPSPRRVFRLNSPQN